jgi:murein DD-endopeptidase MepM/ murein hydrolase activator NlpD
MMGGHLIWPVRNARITQRFGDNYEYYKKTFDILGGHNGIDFGLPAGSPIYATADGIVSMAQDDPTGYGLFCRLYHPQVTLGSLYAHCSELLVHEGDTVTQGQVIAKVGSTGNSTGDHCHWELCCQDNSGYVNVSYGHLRGRANPEVIMWLLGSPPIYR